MAIKIPVKPIFSGPNPVALGEFVSSDQIDSAICYFNNAGRNYITASTVSGALVDLDNSLNTDFIKASGGGTITGSLTISVNLNVTGAVTIGTPLATTYGGTGAATIAGARTNLDVYSTTEADAAFTKNSDNLSTLTNFATARSNLDVYSTTEASGIFLNASSNLSDVGNVVTARSNLSVYSQAETNAAYLKVASNLSDLANAATARTNLGVYGTADVYTKTETSTNFLDTTSNLSDVNNFITARQNLGVSPGGVMGLTLSKQATNTLRVTAGIVHTDTFDGIIRLGSTLDKNVSASWTVGGSNGSLDTGTYAAATGYYVWLIRRSDTGVVDVLTSLSSTAPTMPTNYNQKNLIGYFVSENATTEITKFHHSGNYFWYEPTEEADIRFANFVNASITSAGRTDTMTVNEAPAYARIDAAAAGYCPTQQVYCSFLYFNQSDHPNANSENPWHVVAVVGSLFGQAGRGTVLLDGSRRFTLWTDAIATSSDWNFKAWCIGFEMTTRGNPQ